MDEMLKMYEGEVLDLVSEAIDRGCEVPEMQRVCGGNGWVVYACVDRDEMGADRFEPMLWVVGKFPGEDGSEERVKFEMRLEKVVRNFLKYKPWLRVSGYKGAC